MSMQPAHLPNLRPALEIFQRGAVWNALVTLLEAIRSRFGLAGEILPEPDTSIAWEDGEIEDSAVRRD